MPITFDDNTKEGNDGKKKRSRMELRASILHRKSVLANLPNLDELLSGGISNKLTMEEGKLLILTKSGEEELRKAEEQRKLEAKKKLGPQSRKSIHKQAQKDFKKSWKQKISGKEKPDHLFLQSLRNTLIQKHKICQTLFDGVDSDGDNCISRKEWIDYMSKTMKNDNNDEWQETRKLIIHEFGNVDTDSSLSIDRLEFTMFYMLNNWHEPLLLPQDIETPLSQKQYQEVQIVQTRKRISFYHILLNGVLDEIFNVNKIETKETNNIKQFLDNIYLHKITENQFKKSLDKNANQNSPIGLLNKFVQDKMDNDYSKLSLNNYSGASVCEIVVWMMAFDWYPSNIITIKPEDEIYATVNTYSKLFKQAMGVKWKRT